MQGNIVQLEDMSGNPIYPVSVSAPGEGCPIGSILPFSGTTIPDNYLECKGQALSRTIYAELFAVIGTTYGAGDGSTTFNLPNLGGRVAVGQDTNDTDFDNLGETGGEKTHTLTTQELAGHQHTASMCGITSSGSGAATQGDFYRSDYWNRFQNSGNNVHDYYGMGTLTTKSTGGNQPHNNLQPYITLKYIIKYTNDAMISASVKNQYSTSADEVYSASYMNSALSDKADTSSLATVATSGSYNDLTNKPTIPTVNNATLTIQKNGTNVQTFTANQSTNVTANITTPTFTTLWTNSNTNTNFANTTVTIANLSTYKFIDILVVPYKGGNQNTIHTVRHYYDATRNRGEISQPFRYNNARFYGSRIFTVNAGSVAFDYAYNDANQRADDWYIPWKIIGYKF